MNARAVPSDILCKIVRYALYMRYDEQRKFKEGLKLLAVCQDWRRAALPVVYRYAYISTGGMEIISNDNYSPILDFAEKLSAVKVDTNIGLIQSQNCVELVRKLNICVHYKSLPLLGHAKIANVLSTASPLWPNVHTLNMIMFASTYLGKYKDISSYASLFAETASRFTQLLPDVRHLIFRGNIVNPMAQIFYGNIAGAYNNQLEKLRSRHPIVVPSDLIFTNLKHVEISFNNMTNYQPPSINPRILESLKIINVANAKCWDSFCAGEQSNVTKFLNLKKLHVGQYQFDTLVEDAHNVNQLLFPCLQDLVIDACTTVLPWFFTAVLPTDMKHLVINATHTFFMIPELFAFPAVENLTLNIYSSMNTNKDELLLFVNRILASTNESSNVNLSFLDEDLFVNPLDINSSNITKLYIAGPMTTNNFYAYLARLTQLAELKCGRLMIDEEIEETIFPDPDQLPDANYMPLNICTKTVVIEIRNPGDNIKKMANIVNYLLLKLPNLTELTAEDVPERAVTKFIYAYKQKYPRLSAVRLSLNRPSIFSSFDIFNYETESDTDS